ncbi:MAG: 16S rRNA (guanine(527)-N(7))-methyltransferase RsmG [Burkholderiales bacterium]
MRLEEGLAILGLDVAGPAIGKLLAHAALIEKWNRVYNLTAIRDRDKIVSHHLLDSLAVLPHIEAARCADVGSGAGFPGISLAIARPGWEMVLVESNQKKAAFLRQAAIELDLPNVSVFADRVESLEGSFDLVISRAFSEMGEFVRLSGHLVGRGGYLAAMKGQYPEQELSHLPSGVEVEKVIPLNVPGLEGERHLVIMSMETN